MDTKILVPLSDGFEEMEAVIIVDTLRRGGIDAVTASLGDELIVHGAHGIDITADIMLDDIDLDGFDGVAVPGGMGGTRRNQADGRLLSAIARFHKDGKLVSAICAGPLVLQSAGVLDSASRITCYPGLESELTAATRLDDIVVVDRNIITSQGPATTFAFATALLRYLCGDAVADQVAAGELQNL